MSQKFETLAEFYPFYLNQHRNKTCQRLHYVGSWLTLLLLAWILWSAQWKWLWCLPLVGYGFAWIGHHFFEKNRPATFSYPLYSFICDWIMFKDILLRKLK